MQYFSFILNTVWTIEFVEKLKEEFKFCDFVSYIFFTAPQPWKMSVKVYNRPEGRNHNIIKLQTNGYHAINWKIINYKTYAQKWKIE